MALPVFHVLDRVYTQLQEQDRERPPRGRGEGPGGCSSRHRGRVHRHEDWRKKLDCLQGQHKKETIEQHRQHLEQLHLLQDQLLQEISLNMSVSEHRLESNYSPQGGVELRESRSAELSYSRSGVKACLSSPGKVCPTPDRSRMRHSPLQGAYVSKESLGSPRPPVATTVTRPSKTPQESWEAKNPSTYPRSGRLTEAEAQNPSTYSWSERLTEAEAHHMRSEYRSISPPSRQDGTGYGYSHDHRTDTKYARSHDHRTDTKSPRIEALRDTNFSHVEALRDTKSPHVEASRDTVMISSKVSATRHMRSNSVSHSHTSQCLHQASSTTRLQSHNLSSDSAQILSPRAAKSPAYDRRQSRLSLLEKHAKHIEDLKKYYGAEIASLSEKLNAMEKLLNKSPPARRNLHFDELQMAGKCSRCGAPGEHWEREGGGAGNAETLAELGALKAENSRLEGECGKLQKLLTEKKR